jgi:hypothetical protein
MRPASRARIASASTSTHANEPAINRNSRIHSTGVMIAGLGSNPVMAPSTSDIVGSRV